MTDPFAVLGLPRAFDLDPAALDARVRELARRLHPDRFARAAPAERAAALARATAVNDAKRAVRHWPSRTAHLLALAGHDPAPAGAAEPELLLRQLELRERLEAGDPAVVAELRRRLATLEGEVRAAFADPGWTAPAPAGRIARLLAEARFVERALGDVAHSIRSSRA
ncbi:MAG TPA: Fe-S protein assembly co-chaperone HscB [Anaeromyxobacteraceae bacterium]|nr:Fe-S protein assembly co-chaperone HscB [Anaeromyxobacteraceae bacterium]